MARYDTLKGSSLFKYSLLKTIVMTTLILFIFPQPWLQNSSITTKYRDKNSF